LPLVLGAGLLGWPLWGQGLEQRLWPRSLSVYWVGVAAHGGAGARRLGALAPRTQLEWLGHGQARPRAHSLRSV